MDHGRSMKDSFDRRMEVIVNVMIYMGIAQTG
jgi:hypothetical protein